MQFDIPMHICWGSSYLSVVQKSVDQLTALWFTWAPLTQPDAAVLCIK